MAETQNTDGGKVLGEIKEFDKTALNHATTQVKTGAVDGYLQEKAIQQVETFPKDELKHVDTEEKALLPTVSDIELEKLTDF